jgi:hypothetical protein
MVYHQTSCTFDNESERAALEAQLKQRGFSQVSSLSNLKDSEYQLIEGTSDPNSFEGRKQYGIKWCEDR